MPSSMEANAQAASVCRCSCLCEWSLRRDFQGWFLFGLPAGPYVTDEDVKYIVECIKEAIVS